MDLIHVYAHILDTFQSNVCGHIITACLYMYMITVVGIGLIIIVRDYMGYESMFTYSHSAHHSMVEHVYQSP